MAPQEHTRTNSYRYLTQQRRILDTGGAPPAISWFTRSIKYIGIFPINPNVNQVMCVNKYSYVSHKPKRYSSYVRQLNAIELGHHLVLSHDGSMVLVYANMTGVYGWDPLHTIYPRSGYSSTMDSSWPLNNVRRAATLDPELWYLRLRAGCWVWRSSLPVDT